MLGIEFINHRIIEAVEKANREFHHANLEIYNIWISDMVFEWHWWVNLGLSILPWLLWIRFRKKDSTHRLLYAGFVVLIISSFLDMLGMTLGLWGYSTKVIPIIPPYFPWDFSLIPVIAMLFYQIKPNVKPLFKAVLFSLLSSFVSQPFFAWLQFYNPKHWEHYYSFPIFIMVYLAGYWFLQRDNFNRLTNCGNQGGE